MMVHQRHRKQYEKEIALLKHVVEDPNSESYIKQEQVARDQMTRAAGFEQFALYKLYHEYFDYAVEPLEDDFVMPEPDDEKTRKRVADIMDFENLFVKQ